MLLNILTEPNSRLRARAKEIDLERFNKTELKHLIANMVETMYLKDGVGLAAPQVDESVRLFVISKIYAPGQKEELVLINPTWEKLSIFKVWDEEGCLSVPGLYGQVKRFKKIKVRGLNAKGQMVEFVAENFLARIVQHEVDHLDGVLFIDKAKGLHAVEKNL